MRKEQISHDDAVRAAVRALDDKKAVDIQVIGIGKLTIIADHFIIAGGTSGTHIKALADEVEYKLGEMGVSPDHIQGSAAGGWIVLDYGDFVVHIFTKEQRDFYNLERLWQDGEKLDISPMVSD